MQRRRCCSWRVGSALGIRINGGGEVPYQSNDGCCGEGVGPGAGKERVGVGASNGAIRLALGRTEGKVEEFLMEGWWRGWEWRGGYGRGVVRTEG